MLNTYYLNFFKLHIYSLKNPEQTLEQCTVSYTGCIKNVYIWKIIANRTCGQNLQKLSVTSGSLTPFGISSKCDVRNALLKGHFKNSLCTKISQYLLHLINLGQNMEHVVQAIKVLRNLVPSETSTQMSKNWTFTASLIQT